MAGQSPSPELYMQGEEGDQGWVSWAWSFVPAIVGAEDEEGEEGFYQQGEEGGRSSPQQNPPKDPVVSIGFYCTKASVTFKVGRPGRECVSVCVQGWNIVECARIKI